MFANDEIVYWDTKTTKIPVGKGIVKGVATTENPVIDSMIIVDLGTILNDYYPYQCIAIPEIYLSKENKFS